MHGSLVAPLPNQLMPEAIESIVKSNPYYKAEQTFSELIEAENLDQRLDQFEKQIRYFETALSFALKEAYDQPEGSDAAHLFLQRVLYRINRLNLFWYDDLTHYTNERSTYLQKVRNEIEAAWQAWELSHIDTEAYHSVDIKQALLDRYQTDLDPQLSEGAIYLRQKMPFEGYRYLLAITSFDGLVEASRLSRILGGAANEVQATLTKVLLEEYGNGRLSRKHSTFFAKMMTELSLSTQPEAYFDLVPWQALATTNHNF
jgi:hypothetical protein